MADFWKIQQALDGPHGDNAILYARTKEIVDGADFPTAEAFSSEVIAQFVDRCYELRVPVPHVNLAVQMAGVAGGLYAAERLKDLPPNPADYSRHAYTYGVGQLRDLLLQHQRKALRPTDTVQALTKCLVASFIAIARRLPPIAHHQSDDAPTATVPLLDVLPNVVAVIEAALEPLSSPEAKDLGLFRWIQSTLKHNVDQLQERSGKKKSIPLSEYDGPDIVETYLRDTTFDRIFNVQIPFAVSQEARFSGHWIIAPPGRGKTTLLHSMFLEDLDKGASIIIMDSKGELAEPIRQLAAIQDRLVFIDPDADYPLALNPLDIPNTNIAQRRELIQYIFASLMGLKFTELQRALFRNVLPAVIQLPNANLNTVRTVLIHGVPTEHLGLLSPRQQDFFTDTTHGFKSETYRGTRREIVWRIDDVMSNDLLRTIFEAPKTKLDISKLMDEGRIIVVNTTKRHLGKEGTEFFGRFFLSLILSAAHQRGNRKPQDKLPCYVYIDECYDIIANDTSVPEILDQCRSQKIALILAHQRIDQLSDEVLDAVANCAIRFANSDDDAKYLAPKLRCEPEFLQSLPIGTFAAFVRDLTPRAVALKVPYTDISALPRMTDAQQQAIRQRMREEYGFVAQPAPFPPSTLPAPPAPTVDTRQLNSTAAPEQPPGSAPDTREADSSW